MRIPAKYASLLFGGMMSMIMVTVITGVVLLVTRGIDHDFINHWLKGFAMTWPIAFPTVLVVAPFIRRIVTKLTSQLV